MAPYDAGMSHALPQASPGAPAALESIEALLAKGTTAFRGAYVHVPFCFHKCHYCDFYSFVDSEGRQPAYVERLERELDAARPWVTRPLQTIFVGGGTPTLLQPSLLARALRAVRDRLPLADDLEWTVEANPETVTDEVAATLVAGGVNRVSLGAQSFHPHLLKSLERWHDPASVGRAVGRLRAAGVRRINLDLIFGIPGGSLAEWHGDLDQALALEPEHVSCYGLTYEPNTAMTRRLAQGEFARAPEELEAEMYASACERLAAAGLGQYEISNWARAGEACRHNLLYWRNEDWLAFGPSASGHASGLRWKNVPRLGDWLARGPWSPVVDVERVGDDARVGERLMMGLRLREGVPQAEMAELLAMGRRGEARRRVLDEARAEGLVEAFDGPRGPAVRFTARGQLLADSVLCKLV